MRKTRSGVFFSPYEISPDIDFEELVARSFSQEQDDVTIGQIWSDTSPLTSPPSSCAPSRSPSPSPPITRPEPSSTRLEPIASQPAILLVPSTPSASPKPTPNHRKRQGKKNRAKKRRLSKITGGPKCNQPTPPLKKKHVSSGQALPTKFGLEDIRVAANGFTGYHSRQTALKKEYSLDEMVGPTSKWKFRLIPWDGSYPDDARYKAMTTRVADKFEDVRVEAKLTSKQKKGGRGPFSFISVGPTFGMGMKEPARQTQTSKKREQVANELLNDPDVQRLSGFQSSGFSTWSPELFQSYAENRTVLLDHHPSLRFNFSNSVFAAATFNLGPRTVTVEHADSSNRADGFCAVTALSPTEDGYDYTKGGHLILWDLGLVIEFPPGTTILLPSAILRHSNVSIGKKERRYSYTQYTSGGLFRWVERGFRTQKDYFAGLSDEERLAEEEKDAMRWKEAIGNFSRLGDLL
ncbi:hypothetical protein V5O48_012267 [Marasmius crinis-equi]|uniref:Uncharacterized protein n=1 Tax=Marasmius crinis-equi TaxID=585013 RepID=A0ABR3F383_9AGAR